MSDFKDLITGSSELVLDKLLDDGLLKDIPIISNLVALYNVKTSIADKIFYSKIVSFYEAFSSVDLDAFYEWKKWAGIDIEENEKIAGSIIVYIDSQNELIKCKLIGHLFKSLVEGELSKAEFEKMVHAVSMLSINDMKEHSTNGGDVSPSNESSLSQRLQFVGLYSFTATSLEKKQPLEYEITNLGVKFIDVVESFSW